jgi:RNase P/RNase MRP subunit POP5
MRRGQRYLLVKISGVSAEMEEVKRALKSELSKLLGVAELGRCGYKFIRERYDEKAGLAVLKTSIGGLLPVRAGLCLVSRLGANRAKAEVLRVSGTIKGVLKNVKPVGKAVL